MRGQALQEALVWAASKSLSDRDYQFLTASQELDKREVQRILEAEKQASRILAQAIMALGCSWVGDYLKNNPNVSEIDKRLCDRISINRAY